MSKIIKKVQSKEAAVDAGITKVQTVLEDLKQSPHSAWTLLGIGLLMLAAGVAIWVI